MFVFFDDESQAGHPKGNIHETGLNFKRFLLIFLEVEHLGRLKIDGDVFISLNSDFDVV